MANKKKKCLFCKEFHIAEEGIKTPTGFFCQMDHAVKHARAVSERQRKRQQQKAKQAQAKDDKASRAASKEAKRRDLKWQHGDTFNYTPS